MCKSKILIIGVGAVGSMVARTLVKGGSLDLTLVDYDTKEPENVCRSEYNFLRGVTGKVNELELELISISPFVSVRSSEHLLNSFKLLAHKNNINSVYEEVLKEYNLIIDCSTDNDIVSILDVLTLHSQIISLSITNHAKELICAVSPNLYKWTYAISEKLQDSTGDLYNPLGCSSPTFKASYTDIAVLVQFAIKQIDMYFEEQMPLRNFYLSTSNDGGFGIKLNQF